jgi:hypothetical protein
MLSKKALIVSSVFMIAILILAPLQAKACLCEPMSSKKRVKKMKIEADAIFTGQVNSLEMDQINGRGVRGDKVVLSVKRTWKKGISNTVTVYTSGGCGVGFEVGKTYLVYAKLDTDGELTTSVCMGTRVVAVAAEDLKHLGKPLAILSATDSGDSF